MSLLSRTLPRLRFLKELLSCLFRGGTFFRYFRKPSQSACCLWGLQRTPPCYLFITGGHGAAQVYPCIEKTYPFRIWICAGVPLIPLYSFHPAPYFTLEPLGFFNRGLCLVCSWLPFTPTFFGGGLNEGTTTTTSCGGGVLLFSDPEINRKGLHQKRVASRRAVMEAPRSSRVSSMG